MTTRAQNSWLPAALVLYCSTQVRPSLVAGQVCLPDFSDTSGLMLNGDATVDAGSLRLTPAISWQVGSAFTLQLLNAASFSTHFVFRITDPAGNRVGCNTDPGADGFVLVLQTVGPEAIGLAGGNLGYQPITPSVGVEFDTWCNSVNDDPTSNHIGVISNGSVDHGPGSPCTIHVKPNFDNGQNWYVWIDYDGSTLEVRANQIRVRPQRPLLRCAIDISQLLQSTTAHVGFTAATGGNWESFEIISWQYGAFTPCPADLDGDGEVGTNDLFTLLGAWGPCAGCETPLACPADLECDCIVGTTDLLTLLASWGLCS